MRCTKAIIPVAGYGTRRLPITRAIEKCMLPIGNIPLVDYVVEDCRKAGIEDIYFVISEDSRQLQEYYATNQKLVEYLNAHDKTDLVPLATPPNDVRFHFIIQPDDGRYGTTIPVAVARRLIPKGEPALVLMGDDFLYRRDGGSDIADMLADATGDTMLAVEVPLEMVQGYGVLRTEDGLFREIVEKPRPEDAPSRLINVSKYLMSSQLLDLVVDDADRPREGEYMIIDAINQFVAGGGIITTHINQGIYCDGGSLDGWLVANNVVAGKI